ncbi:hypothetical protein [Pseudomonas sp. C32]|uniref:hypothetical protein n=1 Tax=Pseudomonas sp. C32 TaxID=1529208 RepID=UPI00261D1360|nr:hypothetical protein [Pseudomonas sp. C32]MDN4548035.1 hypothetical protein [Pseudomonas sp. C32]
MAELNPRPDIPELQPGDWIDLDKLGDGPLLTYIKYPSIAIDDALWPNWRGCGASGEVADHSTARVNVSIEGGYTPALGMPVYVPNDVLKKLDQGVAFYSYAVGDPLDPNIKGPESLRVFCYVGKRAQQSANVPVAQIKESHELALDPDDVSEDVTAVVPPYRAMSVGDKVTFKWQGYLQGVPQPEYSKFKVIKAEHLGQPLTFTVDLIEIIGIPGGYAEISYRIEYAGGAGQASDSDVQRIDIVKPESAPLPPITFEGYTGDPINPGTYPNGLTLQVKPVYTDIQEGDWVLVYWTGSERAKSVIKALRVDRSTLDSGLIEFLIEPQWLVANSNGQVQVTYQFARGGVARTAESLPLDIKKSLHLPPPIVKDATADSVGGYLEANTSGVYVKVPDDAETGGGAVEMHWYGHENGGRHIALTPGPDQWFFIPPSAIAANMSTLEQKRFPVFYRVVTDGVDSTPFHLLVTPLPASRYPLTKCRQVRDGKLSLFEVHFNGADLEIDSLPFYAWPFMAEGQLLTMEITGVNKAGQDVRVFARDALPVTPAEFFNKKVDAKLPKDFLEDLELNEKFTMKARVSFDGGQTYTPFRDSDPTLVA